eukprot:COSAG04_NODE_1363_length_7079_cov_19.484815_7_plen_83_part_00
MLEALFTQHNTSRLTVGADSAPLPCKAAAKPPQRACPEFAKMETKGLFPNFGVFKVPFTTKNALACCTFAARNVWRASRLTP